MKEKLILLILFLSINFCFGLRWTTLQPNNTFNWTEITPSFSYLRRSFTPFVAAIVPQGSNLFNCEPIKTNLTGRIALVAFGNCSIDKHMEYVSKAGALGMLLISDGWRVCNNRDQNPNNLTLPTICIDSISTSFKSFLDKFLSNLKERKSTYIDFIPGRNPFDELNKGGMEFRRAWMIFFSSLLIIFSSYKIFKFLRLEKKKKLIITNIIFCFLFGVTLMINNIDFFSYFRVILNFQFQIVYNNLKYLLFFPTLSLLAIIQLRILLKVYGKESSRIIAILIMPIICIFVEVPIIIGMITFSTYKRDPNLFKILNICICIFFGINVLIYWVGSFLLLHRIFKSPDDTLIKKKSTKYLRFSISTILCGLMILFGLICMIYTTVDPYILNNMIEMITVYTLLDNFLLASCFLMTFIFKDSNINNHPATTMTKSINTMSNLDLLKEQYN